MKNALAELIRKKLWNYGIATEEKPQGVSGDDVSALLNEIDKLEEEKQYYRELLGLKNER